MDMLDSLLVNRVAYEKSYLINYSEQLFCQSIKNIFIFALVRIALFLF